MKKLFVGILVAALLFPTLALAGGRHYNHRYNSHRGYHNHRPTVVYRQHHYHNRSVDPILAGILGAVIIGGAYVLSQPRVMEPQIDLYNDGFSDGLNGRPERYQDSRYLRGYLDGLRTRTR